MGYIDKTTDLLTATSLGRQATSTEFGLHEFDADELKGWRMALNYRAKLKLDPTHGSTGDMDLRRVLIDEGQIDCVRDEQLEHILDRVFSYTMDDMPASQLDCDLTAADGHEELVRDFILALDACSFQHGEASRGAAWRRIGVPVKAGRQLLGRNIAMLSWPVWFTLRETSISVE